MEDLSNENIIHKKENGIEYLQFRKLLDYPEVKHCYTTKIGDIDFKTHENNDVLTKSYSKIFACLGEKNAFFIKPHQTHTDNVEIVNSKEQEFNEVDGLITNKENIFLCTTSADCTSILLYDPVKKVVGNIHSGWRGTLKKIGQKAVKKMITEFHSRPEDIICFICPHIRKCHFEVEEDVMNMFKKEFSYTKRLNDIIALGRRKENVQKYNIDTTLINYIILEEVGIKEKNIVDSGICTVCKSQYFHSHRAEKNDGRNAAMIMIKEKK